ncbi:6-phosphogluconolactonase [Gottfriedia luciferensis]|uniref:6-phosphogluconolactonase n=1 Tax=Gottfriedia luciferensis TaxID=178774 RepID=A0ABX2ZVZ2_9BACI|nr:lactonase family protein [Gottfriedia luciferensis]ODG93953.1 6-phosphogluconolactonase [Gottfriedia luciferensis]
MNSNQKFVGYVGTYTKSESKGIYQFTLDTEKEKITDVKPVAELGNPTYLAISEDNKNLYAVVKEGNLGGIAVYSIDENSGELNKLNEQLNEGASPCHISIDSSKQNIVTANYHKGTIELYKINQENGFASDVKSIMQHEGTGPNKERQEKPHAHFSGYTLNEKYVAAIDLGIDKLNTYKIENNSLIEVSSLSVKPGSGPRHITFHPNGKFAYIMTELSSEVIALQLNEDGSFTDLQYISTIPSDFTENNQGSAIHISKDGQFVYAGNRGHNSIAVFSVNQDTGKLELVGITSSEGNWPRDFVLDPSENYLVGSNEMSGNLVLYARNKTTGKLTVLQSDVQVPEAVCVKFLNV